MCLRQHDFVANFHAAAHSEVAGDPRIHHLRYDDFRLDPVDAVHSLYDRAGLPFTKTFESSMRTWLADNPSHRFGKFEYSVDALGVDVAELDRKLDPYRERFNVPREQRK